MRHFFSFLIQTGYSIWGTVSITQPVLYWLFFNYEPPPPISTEKTLQGKEDAYNFFDIHIFSLATPILSVALFKRTIPPYWDISRFSIHKPIKHVWRKCKNNSTNKQSSPRPPCTAPHPQKVMCSLNPRNQKKPHAPHLCYGEFGCVQYVAPGAVIGCDKYSLSCQDIVIVSFSLFWRVRITKRIFLRIKFILSNMMNRSI